eukprot:149936-Pelagomonas_calceolata.AAC.6
MAKVSGMHDHQGCKVSSWCGWTGAHRAIHNCKERPAVPLGLCCSLPGPFANAADHPCKKSKLQREVCNLL